MNRFYLTSALISTLLSSSIALAGSGQNSFGDLFGLEYPLSSFIQRTPAIDDLISASDRIGSESSYLSPEQVIGKPGPKKRLSDEGSMRVSDFDWKELQHLVEMTLDMEPYEAMKIIWSNMNKEQKSHFDKESHGKKFPREFNIIRNLLQQKSSNPPVGNMASLAPEILPQQMMHTFENSQLENLFPPQLSLQTSEMEAPLVEVMAGEESPKGLLHTGGTDFDWRSLHIFVESTLNLELTPASDYIWSLLDVEQRNSFNNDQDNSSFRHSLSRQRKMLRAKKRKPPVHAPETLPQQMVPLIENFQFPDDILIPLPDDFLLPQVDPTTIQSDSVMGNQVEPFVIDDEAIAQLNRLIDEFNSMGEVPREDTVFDWKPLQHLVEETLKKTPRYAIEIIWLEMNKEQRYHFKNNIAERSFVSALMEQRKILRQIKNNPPVEIIESPAPEMLPQVTEPLSEYGQVSEDFVLPPADPTSVKPVFDVETYNEVMASLNPMPEEYDSREATPSEDSEPRLSLSASQVEAPQTQESAGGSESPESLSPRSSADSDWKASQKLVEMDEESVSMEAPMTVQAIARRDSREGGPIQRLYFKWKPYQHLVETSLDMKIEEATEIIWSNLTQADQNHFKNKRNPRAFYYSLFHHRKKFK